MIEKWISPQYLTEQKIKSLRQAFLNNQPSPYNQLPDFFRQDKAVAILKALGTEKFFFKEADLFKFKQTEDFQNMGNKILKEFRTFLSSKEFINYMHKLTAQQLKPNSIDISASLYEDTDYLLPHDDQVEGRKIAFFLYLCTLDEKNGGKLLLYQGNKVSKVIIPRFNTFAFFLVSPQSIHAVEEVIASQRTAISGWFHGN